MSDHTQPWSFRKLVRLHPSVPAIEVEMLSVPAPVVCVVCGGTGSVPSSQRPSSREWDLSCNVCGGSGQIGGGG